MAAKVASAHRDGRIPLILGITGHRDLRPEDVPMLEARIAGIIKELQADFPNTPLLLLSPLAEGADRLVARVAVTMGVGLVVPLPMPQSEYECDFQGHDSTEENEASLLEFRTLLGQADLCFELPFAAGATLASVRTI
ncbi:MAG TPA: hypothetical protein VD902_00140, partial [Symbiobacteriaceae bacterium]|nr:hypothetical protein [Symbiobacteriaceae bacterium]